MIKKIIFTTDIFRVSDGVEYYLDVFLASVYKLFCYQIFLVTEEYPILNYSKDKNIFDIKKFYDLCGYEYNESNWLKISSGKISELAERYFVESFNNYIIISYHANPLMIKLFKKYDITYIDMFEGSIRFLEDLHFAMRSNNLEIYHNLLKYEFPKENIYMEANRLSAKYKSFLVNDKYVNLKDNSLLLCGQVQSDISLLINGEYIKLSDKKDIFSKIVKEYDYLYYKPHPYARNDEENQAFIKEFIDFEICYHNIYSMLSSPSIVGVAALSSGTLHEAKYFNKKVHILSHLYVDYYNDVVDTDKFITLNTEYFSPTFWANILNPIIKVNDNIKYFNFNNNTNYMRNNIFAWWGYEQGINENDIKYQVYDRIHNELISLKNTNNYLNNEVEILKNTNNYLNNEVEILKNNTNYFNNVLINVINSICWWLPIRKWRNN
ncbi:hypothetical protein R4Q14_15405, partial [Brachyspira intermedia]